MERSTPADRASAAWADYVLVALVGGVIVFWRLGAISLDNHESKLALVARTMIQPPLWLTESDEHYAIPPATSINRWLVPVENGRPRLQKTPLPYWAVAGVALAHRAARFGGTAVNNVTVRLPSAVSAVLCALIVLAMGRRMFGHRAALLGALLMVTCIGFQKWGRDARPEMLLCLLVTGAMAAFYFGIEASSHRRHLAWMAAFWVLLGLANLAKQFVPFLVLWPIAVYLFWRQSFLDRGDETSLKRLRIFLAATAVGLAVHVCISLVPLLRWWRPMGIGDEAGSYLTMAAAFGLPLLGYLRISRPWRQILSLLPTAVPGLILAVAMFAWWLLYIRNLFPQLAGESLAQEVTDRAAGVGKWSVDSPIRYVAALTLYLLPWLALVPGACAVGLMRRFHRHRSGLVYLLVWCVGFVALFTAMAGKRDHYILPMIPAFCLLMGFVAEDVFFRHVWIGPAMARWIGAVYAPMGLVGVAVAAVRYFTGDREARWVHMGVVAAAVTLPVALGGWLIWRQRFRAGLAMLLASITLVYVAFYHRVDLWDMNRPLTEFAASAARIVPADAPVYHWGDPQAKMVFYFGRYIPAVQWPFQWSGLHVSVDIDNAAAAWLAEDPRHGPWMFGYDVDERVLVPLGYLPVLRVPGKEDKKLVYVLYRRLEAGSQPTSSSAPADEGDAASGPAGAFGDNGPAKPGD
jgi:4-amino-4-deoxy-L-arabinose transferase-like glycosyltransferase